jgi:3-deoxy-manno-octulosonate cytidylyltransferase (CMP-KDO synthetase)
MNPIIIIPARMASTRLPEKPLADLRGKPMVLHVLERGLEADIGPVVVACDDIRVEEVVREAGGTVCMTDPSLPSGSDRVYAALSAIDSLMHYDVVVNLQGDSPTTDPTLIRTCVKALQKKDFDVSTVAVKKLDMQEALNPNICKIALGGSEEEEVRQAIYFSRSVIPAGSDFFYHHIGLYGYRRKALERFVRHQVCELEKIERLEQLRALELGLRIGVTLVDTIPHEVNTPEDLDIVRGYLSQYA